MKSLRVGGNIIYLGVLGGVLWLAYHVLDPNSNGQMSRESFTWMMAFLILFWLQWFLEFLAFVRIIPAPFTWSSICEFWEAQFGWGWGGLLQVAAGWAVPLVALQFVMQLILPQDIGVLRNAAIVAGGALALVTFFGPLRRKDTNPSGPGEIGRNNNSEL